MGPRPDSCRSSESSYPPTPHRPPSLPPSTCSCDFVSGSPVGRMWRPCSVPALIWPGGRWASTWGRAAPPLWTWWGTCAAGSWFPSPASPRRPPPTAAWGAACGSAGGDVPSFSQHPDPRMSTERPMHRGSACDDGAKKIASRPTYHKCTLLNKAEWNKTNMSGGFKKNKINTTYHKEEGKTYFCSVKT